MVIPYFSGTLGNAILTEGISYPFFLLGTCSLLSGIYNKREKDFLVYLVYITLLVLIRGQFLFLYVVFPFIIVWLYRTNAKARIGMLAACCILSIFTGTLLERTYHLLANQRFITTPFGGMQIAIAPMYLSTPQDSLLFSDTLQKSIFTETRAGMVSHNLIPEGWELYFPYAFALNYDKILYTELMPTLNIHGCLDPVENDRIMNNIALTLIKHNDISFLHLYVNNVIYYFGGVYYCVVVCLFLVFALYFTIKHPANVFSSASFFILLMAVGNATATCLFIFVQKRYTIYTDPFIMVLLLIAVSRCFQSYFQNEDANNSRGLQKS